MRVGNMAGNIAASRNYIIQRRSATGTDLSRVNPLSATISFEDAVKAGYLVQNSTIMVGIATEQEAGLSATRWPVRVVLEDSLRVRDKVVAQLTVKGFSVVDDTDTPVPFVQSDEALDRAVDMLFRSCPDLSDTLREVHNNVIIRAGAVAQLGIVYPDGDELAGILASVFPTPEQVKRMVEIVTANCETAIANGQEVLIKLTNGRYLSSAPHGLVPAEWNKVPAHQVPLVEYFLTYALNYQLLKERYPTILDGTLTFSASCIASMFRMGLQEVHAGAEYYTMAAKDVGNKRFEITGFIGNQPADHSSLTKAGTQLDLSTVKLDPVLMQLGAAGVVTAGNMHYMFNHTTGGSHLCGPLLSLTMMYKVYNPTLTTVSEEDQTSCIYDALHPVCKRAIANVFYPSSKVHTFGRDSTAFAFENIQLDTFMRIRMAPYPAGSHKAYICLLALRRICSSHLTPFLPWAGELNQVITICEQVTRGGARAHMGSYYYTGKHPTTQSSQLDTYMPELAAFFQVMCRNDTLALSPHLGPDVAARANTNWVSLLKAVRGADISSVDPGTVKAYLETTGHVTFVFNKDDKSTWGLTTKNTVDALDAIDRAMGV